MDQARLLNRLRQQSDDTPLLTVLNPKGMNGHDLITAGKDFHALPATQPMTHVPGSLERIEEMRKRVSRCEELWHPDDCDSFEAVVEPPKPSEVIDPKQRLSKAEQCVYQDIGKTFNPRGRRIVEDDDGRRIL